MNSSQGFRVAILATHGFEEVELVEARKALDEAGAQTTALAPKPGEIQGMNHIEKGSRIAVEGELKDASPDEFNALLLPGGVVNAGKLRMDEDARRFVPWIKSNRPIAVICHGPWLLVSAGLVKGRRLTSYFAVTFACFWRQSR